MNAYRQYWLLTGLFVSAAIFGVHAGIVGWVMTKFPDLQGQLITLVIIGIFLYTYIVHGHQAAKRLSKNHLALQCIESGGSMYHDGTEVEISLKEVLNLRKAGVEAGQSDFSKLYEVAEDQFEDQISVRIGQIDTIRVFLFFVGLLFTVVGIVQGFAFQQSPTNAEEAKMYSSAIIKALGLAYLPATECLGATLILFVLSNLLQSHANALIAGFRRVLYRAVFLGVH